MSISFAPVSPEPRKDAPPKTTPERDRPIESPPKSVRFAEGIPDGRPLKKDAKSPLTLAELVKVTKDIEGSPATQMRHLCKEYRSLVKHKDRSRTFQMMQARVQEKALRILGENPSVKIHKTLQRSLSAMRYALELDELFLQLDQQLELEDIRPLRKKSFSVLCAIIPALKPHEEATYHTMSDKIFLVRADDLYFIYAHSEFPVTKKAFLEHGFAALTDQKIPVAVKEIEEKAKRLFSEEDVDEKTLIPTTIIEAVQHLQRTCAEDEDAQRFAISLLPMGRQITRPIFFRRGLASEFTDEHFQNFIDKPHMLQHKMMDRAKAMLREEPYGTSFFAESVLTESNPKRFFEQMTLLVNVISKTHTSPAKTLQALFDAYQKYPSESCLIMIQRAFRRLPREQQEIFIEIVGTDVEDIKALFRNQRTLRKGCERLLFEERLKEKSDTPLNRLHHLTSSERIYFRDYSVVKAKAKEAYDRLPERQKTLIKHLIWVHTGKIETLGRDIASPIIEENILHKAVISAIQTGFEAMKDSRRHALHAAVNNSDDVEDILATREDVRRELVVIGGTGREIEEEPQGDKVFCALLRTEF